MNKINQTELQDFEARAKRMMGDACYLNHVLEKNFIPEEHTKHITLNADRIPVDEDQLCTINFGLQSVIRTLAKETKKLAATVHKCHYENAERELETFLR